MNPSTPTSTSPRAHPLQAGPTSTSHECKSTRVICVGNQKGGVGKTTNTVNLAAALAELGRTSLIIDLDPSAGATKNLGAPTTGWANAFDLLTGADPEDCILTSEDEGITLPRGIHLVPGTETLGTLGHWLAQPENVFKPLPALLVDAIASLRGRYDYIWFDTPPTHTHQTTPALTVADYAIVSTKPEARSVDAIGPAVQYIMRAKAQANPKLRLLGIVLNAMPGQKTRLASSLVEDIEKSAKGLEFRPYLKSKVCLQEAEKAAQTIFDYDPSSETADQYRELARQIEQRIERFEAEAAAPETTTGDHEDTHQEAEEPVQTTLDYEPSDETEDPQPDPAPQVEERTELGDTEAAGLAIREIVPVAPQGPAREAEPEEQTMLDDEPSGESADPHGDVEEQVEDRSEDRIERFDAEAADPAPHEAEPVDPEPTEPVALRPADGRVPWVARIRAILPRWLSRLSGFLRKAG